MNRKALAAVLVVPLLAAVVFALWPASDVSTSPLPTAGGERSERRTQPPQNEASVSAVAPVANSEVPIGGPGKPLSAPPPAAQPSQQLAAPSPSSRDIVGVSDAPAQQPAPKSPPHKLDREGIRSAIREKLPEMQDCYESWLAQNPELGGTVAISFQVINADGGGVVQNITIVDGGVGHRAFEGCVGNVFNDLEFESPGVESMNVTYPVMFSNNPAP